MVLDKIILISFPVILLISFFLVKNYNLLFLKNIKTQLFQNWFNYKKSKSHLFTFWHQPFLEYVKIEYCTFWSIYYVNLL